MPTKPVGQIVAGYNAGMLNQAKIENFQKSIILTLAYFEQFAYPLTTDELWLRLLCLQAFRSAGVADQSFKPTKKFGNWSESVQNNGGSTTNQSIANQRITSQSIVSQLVGSVGHESIESAESTHLCLADLIRWQQNIYQDKHLFARALGELRKRGLAQFIKPHWHLGSTKWHNQRINRQEISDQKIAQLWPVVLVARFLPWIAGLAITGSAAVGNAAKNDDVDVMIVTENNRLWLVRPIIVVLSFLFGRRRSWNKEEPNSWCFNLWLERQAVQMPLESRSAYTAYEICQTKWLVSKDRVRQEFFGTNRWVRVLLPNYFSRAINASAKHESQSILSGLPLIQELLNILNVVAFQLQYLYMRRHITRERVGYTSAFFHPRDTGEIIHARWLKQIWGLIPSILFLFEYPPQCFF